MTPAPLDSKARSLALLFVAEVAAMSLWFVSAAILPEMSAEFIISPARQAALSSGVQIGFVIGALASAVLGLADRFDPRRTFALSALAAGFLNAGLLVFEPGSDITIAIRVATGALLAGVYPVGMKIAVGWGKEDRGFLVGALVGALTLGNALPHLFALGGGSDWRVTVIIASVACIAGGLACLGTGLGPYHARAPGFDPRAITQAWTNRRVRLAYAGYLGHMWELFSMWAWIGAATAIAYGMHMAEPEALRLARWTAFLTISVGAVACVVAGIYADRVGKAEVAAICMVVSAAAALATAFTFGGPVWLTFVLVMIWGLSVIPDSAQFSALVADAAPPESAGSLMTFQTALGFALTFFTVQATPILAASFGWPVVLGGMAIGPILGIWAMLRLRAMG